MSLCDAIATFFVISTISSINTWADYYRNKANELVSACVCVYLIIYALMYI